MAGEDYDSPFIITSLTGSLLWALNYAHYLLRQGYSDVELYLINTLKIPEGQVYAARFLSAFLKIKPLGVPWHDNPYHESFVFCGVPVDAVLGVVRLDSVEEALMKKSIDILLPGYGQLDRQERLYRSLDRFQRPWNIPGQGARVTDQDIYIATWIARQFMRNFDQDVHVLISMMFLSLRKRAWDEEACDTLATEFEGVWP